ncbi:type I methionyl aminopeptidase [Desulfuribacillus stibiiarsenatis]|uniref:Methionine aminopeptidase n=1 Tax=Desulfuribacillus stibiiarsenatis TaxID=1390249 RepID=A0A1E5L8G5_9FIRM|nr:type I methionyl aminopeptidase [Desulfuribacillus stibiiarsenatis]OEH86348.1 type I methionyl aminopeptidase [Desulfuribacillus stibiiarsenatis]
MIICKSDNELNLMREAGRIVALTHEELRKAVEPGITTMQLDQIAEATIRKHGAEPSFKGYSGFPASICASINEELVHGIPSNRALKDGDIISIDVGAYIHGFHGDAAVTLPVGQISNEAKNLLEVTEQSLYEGISKAFINNRLSDISHAVQQYVEKFGYSIVREYVGHGIGRNMHEDPQIPNFGPPSRGPVLKKGMVLAIEPMVNVGTHHVKTLLDNWTVVTQDGKLCAHFEHTVAITENGPEILTKL